MHLKLFHTNNFSIQAEYEYPKDNQLFKPLLEFGNNLPHSGLISYVIYKRVGKEYIYI